MSDFTHARICIRHNSGSVEIQAPAGEVTWLDLSGLHALPIANGKGGRRKRRLLTTFVFLGFSAAAAAAGEAGVVFMSNSRAFSAGTRAEASALEQSALLPDFATANAIQAPRVLPAPGPLPHPAAHDADPFGLKR